MAKVTVITDENNRVVGAIRNGIVQAGNVTLQFRAHPQSKHKHQELDVPDEAMRSLEDLKKHLMGKAAAR
jgi:hypothetical protein